MFTEGLYMIIELTEEERAFLERLCKRSEIYYLKYMHQNPSDYQTIKKLIKKFEKSNDH